MMITHHSTAPSNKLTMITLLSLLLLTTTTANKHIPFGYQSNSFTTSDENIKDPKSIDPSSYPGSIHYDPLHHALYITGVTYTNTFDGNDDFNLLHEQSGWDLGLSRYTPRNGDCFYAVFKLPQDRAAYAFQPGNAIQSGVTLMHSRRFGSRSASEACSAVDILPPKVAEEGLGGYMHEFENVEGYNEFPPTASPAPSGATYYPTYVPSVTGRPTVVRGVVPEETVETVSVNPNDVMDDDAVEDMTISNVARKVRIYHDVSPDGVIALKEVQIFDDSAKPWLAANLALGKTATQSSDWSVQHLASMAIDGDVDTFSHTMGGEQNSWWEVDLGQDMTIGRIKVVNRDCANANCFARLSYVTLDLINDMGNVVAKRNFGDMSDKEEIEFDFMDFITTSAATTASGGDGSNAEVLVASSNPPIDSFDSTPAQNQPTTFPSISVKPTAEKPSTGDVDNISTSSLTWRAQKVRIQLVPEASSGPLTLVEVVINAIKDIPSNLAAGQIATQSTTDPSIAHPAGDAVDLDMESFSQTDPNDAEAWWEVDLGEMKDIAEIIIHNYKENLGALSYAMVLLFDDQGMGVADVDLGDVSDQDEIKLYPGESAFDFGVNPRRLEAENVEEEAERELGPPGISNMPTRSVRLLVAGHVESVNYNEGYIVEDLVEGQYDESNVYGFAQQVDIRLPLGAMKDEPDFMNDFMIMNDPKANVNGFAYSLEEESLGGFVTSGIDAKALLNDHLPITLNTIYPVALVADSSSKKHYYVLILASDKADWNVEGKDDAGLELDTTLGSGASQQAWTDYQDFGVPGVISAGDFFGKKGRPKFGSDYRIVLKKMTIDNVDTSCVIEARKGERKAQDTAAECKEFSPIEKILSDTSYNRDTIVHSQEWVQEFEPDLGEDTRPAGLIFAPANIPGDPDLLIMGGTTSGNGVAFGTNEEIFSAGDDPQRFDLDGFITKIRADNGSFSGRDAFDGTTNSFTNTHSLRVSSQPNKHDIVASMCSDPLREWGTPEPQDHVYVVGSTEGLLPGLAAEKRDEAFVKKYPQEAAVNSMEAFLMKVDLATMNPVWTVQIAGINLVGQIKGNAFGFGCAVTHDAENVFLTGMVKDGGVVTDFSADSLIKHNNAPRGGSDVFVASYKASDGTLVFLRQIGSTKDDMPSRGNGGITVDRIGNPIIVGSTRGSLMRMRDVAEYTFGLDGADAASDMFIMSLERDSGEYAPISHDTSTPVIPVDNSGFSDTIDIVGASATSSVESESTDTGSSAASIFLFVVLVILLAGTVMGSAFFLYKTRKIEQQKAREMHRNNISPHGRRRSTWGLQGKPGGSVLNQFEDMNIMVEVRNSASGGWHGTYDDEALQQIDFLGASRGSENDVLENSLFMEDGMKALEEIEKGHNNNNYSIGDDADEDDEEVTDEDLIQAYNEAMAIDIEPESEAVAALTASLNMPNFGSDHELT